MTFTGKNTNLIFNENMLIWSLPYKISLSTSTVYTTVSQWVCVLIRGSQRLPGIPDTPQGPFSDSVQNKAQVFGFLPKQASRLSLRKEPCASEPSTPESSPLSLNPVFSSCLTLSPLSLRIQPCCLNSVKELYLLVIRILNANPIIGAPPAFNLVKALSPHHILDLNLVPYSVLTPVGSSEFKPKSHLSCFPPSHLPACSLDLLLLSQSCLTRFSLLAEGGAGGALLTYLGVLIQS